MEQKFRLDKNGKIADDDVIYEKLNLWHDKDEYDKILSTLQSIPRKLWSNKLWFRLISTLNNLKRFDEAYTELEKIKKYCKTPKDQASAMYMLGYIHYMKDEEFKALEFFKQAMQLDNERNLFDDCRDCEKYIRKYFEKLVQTTSMLNQFFTEKEQAVSDTDKEIISAERLPLILAFLPSIRRLSVVETAMQTEDIHFKYKSEEKETVRKLLLKTYQTSDFKTLKKAVKSCFHIDNNYQDIIDYTLGHPNFDPEQLNPSERLGWNASMQYFEQIIEYIPNGGLIAWDMSETIGLTRHAYACDLINENELASIVNDCTEKLLKKYTSWSEYLTALILGGSYFLFMNDFNIKASVQFMTTIGKLLLQSPLFSYKWITDINETI